MAFDSAALAASVHELKATVLGHRVNRVLQPRPDTVVLVTYGRGETSRIVLSANPRHARLHLTRVEQPNPAKPPTFCMLLRKHLEGGRIARVEQDGRERVCHLAVEAIDELGNPVEYLLVAEVMGKHSNIVLLGPGGRIIDATRRVTEEVNRYREVLPGLRYVPPPRQDKLDPAAMGAVDLLKRLQSAPGGDKVWQALLDAVDGLGPLAAKDLAAQAGAEGPVAALRSDQVLELAAVVAAYAAQVDAGQFSPALLRDAAGRSVDFAAVAPRAWSGALQPFESMSALCDTFYTQREESERLQAQQRAIASVLKAETDRCRKKLHLQEQAWAQAEGAEEYKRKAELLTAHLWAVEKGATAVEVQNYYDPAGGSLTVELDPSLTPSENTQAYWHRYQKARSGREAIAHQLEQTRQELEYLEQVEAALQEATGLPDLEEIRGELAAQGYVKEAVVRGKPGAKPGRAPHKESKAHPQLSAPLQVRSSDGLEIWVGRNNRQNDYLTLRLAAPTDLWLHAQKIPGSHVIVRLPPGTDVPEATLREAALLAAYHSKARGSGQVPVDYALRKHVRKPAGARPGMVIYENQRTLYVTPTPDALPAGMAGPGAEP